VREVNVSLRSKNRSKSSEARKRNHAVLPSVIRRILILDVDPLNVRSLLDLLEQSGVAVKADVLDRQESFREQLGTTDYQFILADFFLGNWTALDALEILKASGKDIPFIVVAASVGDESAAECIKRGAADFVLKDKVARLPTLFDQILRERAARAQPQRVSIREATPVDIGNRTHADAENARLVTAIEQSTEAVVITDPSGQIEYVNPAFTRITQYGSDEVLGKNPRLLKSGKHDPEYYQDLWETIRKGEPWHGEIVNQRKDGTHYTEQMSITPVRDGTGEITHFVAVKQDVTEHRKLEEHVRQGAKMEAIGRLAGGVAHDFNNLLTIINGYSELLLEKLASDGEASAQLQEIKDAGERAATLTRQLLAFSRRQVLAPQVLDLNEVVSNLGKMLRRLIGEDIELRTLLDPALGRVRADPGQIEQVIMNLAVNARDAMPMGGKLTIETRNAELDAVYARSHVTVKPGIHVMMAVSDTGVGMSRETQKHIFEPFFTTKEDGRGTGLGLATVYGIVKQSGGSIWVYSEPGNGTVFKVYLPTIAGSTAAEPSGAETQSDSGTETIMVIEDEDGVRSLVRLALESGGYKVLEMDDAESAIGVCAKYEGPIHLILTDVVMRGLSGPLAAAKLVTLRPDVKVIYMSGYTDDAVVHHGVLTHNMPFIQKPFSPASLRKKIREVLDRK
jgi:two-component system cell cycle sensor histidine kinase/response regulator CckA